MKWTLALVVAAGFLGCHEHKPRPVDECTTDCADAGEPDAEADAADAGDQ